VEWKWAHVLLPPAAANKQADQAVTAPVAGTPGLEVGAFWDSVRVFP